MKKIHKFFSKDLLHILGAVGIFVAFLISIAYKQVGIGALIAAWLIAMAIIGVAWITDIRKADLLKNGKIVSGKVNAVKRVHIKFHMSTYHLADEDVIYPWVIRYQYKIGKDTYYGHFLSRGFVTLGIRINREEDCGHTGKISQPKLIPMRFATVRSSQPSGILRVLPAISSRRLEMT